MNQDFKIKSIWKKVGISLIFSIIFLLLSVSTTKAWWNSSWSYRRNITINNTQNSNTLTDYQVAINITYDSDMQSDFDDIRFVDSDDSTELSYWIEDKVDDSWAYVWVKIPSILASSTKDIYMYYGNPSTTSKSNQTAVCPAGVHLDVENNEKCWLFYDNFSTNPFDRGWTRSDTSVIWDSSTTTIYMTSDGGYDDMAKTIFNFEIPLSEKFDVAYEARASGYTGSGGGVTFRFGSLEVGSHQSPDTWNERRVVCGVTWANNHWLVCNPTGVLSPIPINNVFTRIRLLLNRTNATLYANVTDGTELVFVATNGFWKYLTNITYIDRTDIRQPWDIAIKGVDWVGLRKFADPEPTYSIGAEESAVQPPFVYTPKTYDENYVEKGTFETNEKVVIRVNITDPQGAEDIDKVLITIINPSTTIKVNNATMTNISSITDGYTYEYNYTISNEEDSNGTWTVNIYANDTQNAWDSNSTSFTAMRGIFFASGFPNEVKSFRINEFVTINGNNFTLGGTPYKFIGMNSYYLVDYATNHTYDDDGNKIDNSREYVLEVLNEMHYLNINMLRTWANMQCGNNETGYSVWDCEKIGGHYNAFEVNKTGNYNEEMFKALDWLISEASKRDIRVMLVLVNNWNDYGGMRWYVQQSPTTDKTYENITDYDDPHYWEFHDQFYTDSNCKQYYKNYISHLLNRKNTITGVYYKDDPTIFALALANEPRAKTDGTESQQKIINWATEMTDYIRTIDTKHLVTLGIEGFGDPFEGTSFIDDQNTTGVNFTTYNLNPYQWDWFAERSEHSTDLDWADEGWNSSEVIDWWTNESDLTYNNRYESGYNPNYRPDLGRHGYSNWLTQHIDWSKNNLNKPILLQELLYPLSTGKVAVYGDKVSDELRNKFLNQSVINFFENGGDGLYFWTLQHDDYYWSTANSSYPGKMDDGFGFYLSNNETLRNKSKVVLNVIKYAKDAGYIRLLNDYKYDIDINVSVKGGNITNATLFLNIYNGSWTGYFADQSNSSVIEENSVYTFSKQFAITDEQFYYKVQVCSDLPSCVNSTEIGPITIKTNTPVIETISPEDGSILTPGTVTFAYNVSSDLDITHCDLYINDSVNQTDTTVTRDKTQYFYVTLGEGFYTWYVECEDIDDNVETSTVNNLTIVLPPSVNTPKTYDENYVEKTSFGVDNKVIIKVNITDPYGAEDIDKILIEIIDNSSNIKVDNETMLNVSSITDGYTYEYNYTLPSDAVLGVWTINVYANDTRNIWDSNSTTFNVLPTLICKQWVEFPWSNNTHVNITLNVWIYNNLPIDITSDILVDVDENYTDYTIGGLNVGESNLHSETKLWQRPANSDAEFNFTSVSLSGGALGTSNELKFILPVDPATKYIILPTIEFISQTPSNLNESSTEPVTIIVNITDESGINLSKVAFFTGINHTLTQDFFHYNWSWRYPANALQQDMRRADYRNMSYWFEDVVFKESPDDIWTFAGYDNTTYEFEVIDEGDNYVTLNITFFSAQMMFPQIFPFDKMYLTAENKTGQYVELHNNNWMKIKFYPSIFYNYTTENYTIYIDLDVDPDFTPNTKPLEIFFCNSSYTTGDPLDSDYCAYVEDIDATDTRTIKINQSSYIQNIIYISDGYIDGVKVTDEACLVLRTTVPSAKAFRLYYADDEINQYINFTDFNHAWVSTDKGDTWNLVSYTPDFYLISTQGERDKVMYYVYVCNNLNNCVNSSIQYDSLDPVNHPPAEPLITKPEENESVTNLYNITWLTIGDPDFNSFNASVYLCNPDGSINTTLADNNITGDNTQYKYNFEINFSSFPSGKYRINVTLCDIHSLCSSSLTAYNFTVYHQYNKTIEQFFTTIITTIRNAISLRPLIVLLTILTQIARHLSLTRLIEVPPYITITSKIIRIPYLTTQTIAITNIVTRTITVIRENTQEILTTINLAKVVSVIRQLFQPTTLTLVLTRNIIIQRISEVLINVSISLTKWISIIREIPQTITITNVISRVIYVARGASQTVALAITVLRSIVIERIAEVLPSIASLIFKSYITSRQLFQTITSTLTVTLIKIQYITQTISIIAQVSRQLALVRVVYLQPIISTIIKITAPVRKIFILPSPPYALFTWFTSLENLVGLFIALGGISTISLYFLWNKRKELWKHPFEKYKE